MSSFAQLKQKRHGKGEKSYAATFPTTDVLLPQAEAPAVEVKPDSVGQISYNPEFPAILPQDLEIRIHKADEIEKGRGIYSRRGRKPGA